MSPGIGIGFFISYPVRVKLDVLPIFNFFVHRFHGKFYCLKIYITPNFNHFSMTGLILMSIQ